MIAGGMAGLAVLSEVFASVSTGFAILLLRHLLDANSMAEAAGVLVAFFRDMGRAAYPVFFAILVGIQVLPLMSGLPYIILAGAIFGPAAGLAVVSAASSFAACISCTIARGISRWHGFDLACVSPSAAALDRALASRGPGTMLLLVTLLRLSPVVPFTFSNYLFGLSSIDLAVLGIGTLVGTLPSQAAYVAAGSLGQKALSGQLQLPPILLVCGVAATILAMVLVGRVAKQTLSNLHSGGGGSQAGPLSI